MKKNISVEKYLNQILNCVLWTQYHGFIEKEIRDHINDSLDDCLTKGMDKETAIKKTLEQLGDAEKVGMQLNNYYVPRINLRIWVIVLFTYCLHIFLDLFNNEHAYTLMEIVVDALFVGLAILGMAVLKFIDLQKIFRCYKYIYFATLFLLFALLCSGLQFITQKDISCIIAYVLPLLYAYLVYRLHGSGMAGIIVLLLGIVFPVAVFLRLNNFSASLLFAITSISVLWYAVKCNWFCINECKIILFFLFGMMLLGTIFACIYVLGIRTFDFMEANYIREYIRRLPLLTRTIVDNYVKDYPLTTYMVKHGKIIILIYGALIVSFFLEIWRKYKVTTNFFAKLIIQVIALIIFLEALFSILLNLGFPFIKTFGPPFIDSSPWQIVNIMLIFLLDYFCCFGNYIFSDFSFNQNNRFFLIERGKVTFITSYIDSCKRRNNIEKT